VAVDRTLVGVGHPVRVAWDVDDAEAVTVDGVDGLPAAGHTYLIRRDSGPIVVTAHNGDGCSSIALTVLAVDLPSVEAIVVPQAPVVRLVANVGTDLRSPVDLFEAVRDRYDGGVRALPPELPEQLRRPLDPPRGLRPVP
jgi:hypothetical protein